MCALGYNSADCANTEVDSMTFRVVLISIIGLLLSSCGSSKDDAIQHSKRFPVDPYGLSIDEINQIEAFDKFAYFAFASAVNCEQSEALSELKSMYIQVMKDDFGYAETSRFTLELFSTKNVTEIPNKIKRKAKSLAERDQGLPLGVAVWVAERIEHKCTYRSVDTKRLAPYVSKVKEISKKAQRCTENGPCGEVSLFDYAGYKDGTKLSDLKRQKLTTPQDGGLKPVDYRKLTEEEITSIWVLDRIAQETYATASACRNTSKLRKVDAIYKNIYGDILGFPKSMEQTRSIFLENKVSQIEKLLTQRVDENAKYITTKSHGHTHLWKAITRLSPGLEPCINMERDLRTFEEFSQKVKSKNWNSKRCEHHGCEEINFINGAKLARDSRR